ncbi:Protein of unknown function DUF247 [Macleaya cordata]|uniref:Uncharacterized protein n=1 Tax=Macleaya cordata TaxID=56857 RepID=A0A200QIY2_MACCD|nr:Protein of unknown function DUF247 [Macleaya cordata]
MEENQEIEDQNKVVAASIRSKIKPFPSPRWCIYRVPKKLRTVKEEAYVPQIVSIGPFHRGKPTLQAMEDHKNWYLQAFISRTSSTEYKSTLEDLVKAMRELETQARECYGEEIDDQFTSNEFVEMMLLDGCFIIELLLRAAGEGVRIPNDRIFGSVWMLFSLQHDLILLENQIPFFVLERIFSLICRDPEHGDPSLNRLVLRFFDAMLPKIQVIPQTRSDFSIINKPKHVLDLLRSILLPSSGRMDDAGHYPVWEFTRCVTDLWEAGVNFKKKEQADGLLDIQFNDKDGIFEIPPFFFDESTDVILRNLVAMEQCDGTLKPLVTSYVLLLDILINSEKDVRLLCHKKIVQCYLGDDEELAVVINNLCKGVSITKFYHDGLCHRCNAYFETKWHKWRAILKHDYFNTPWAVLSFTAAVILLLLTFLQTLFAILSYHH